MRLLPHRSSTMIGRVRWTGLKWESRLTITLRKLLAEATMHQSAHRLNTIVLAHLPASRIVPLLASTTCLPAQACRTARSLPLLHLLPLTRQFLRSLPPPMPPRSRTLQSMLQIAPCSRPADRDLCVVKKAGGTTGALKSTMLSRPLLLLTTTVE